MTLRLRSILLVLMAVTVGVLTFVFHPKAEETEEGAPPAVSETDVQTYIKVYSAMQDDHDLTIENAIKPYNISLDDFRQTERRIQGEARTVERVREALIDHAKKHGVYAQAGAIVTPTPTVSVPAHSDKKKAHDKKK